LGRLYREARRGGVPVVDASRLATILSALRECLKASDTNSDVLVIRRVMVAPPELPIEEPPAIPEPVTPSIDRPSQPDAQPSRFSRILPEPVGIV
jgi:hypothetical protein